MKSVFTSAIAILLLVGISSKSFGQCGPIYENFNNTGGSTAGFTGTPASSFGLSGAALNFFNLSDGTYTLTTPVLTLPAIATSIDYGFFLAGNSNASVTGITVSIKYVNTSDRVVTSSPTTISSGTSSTITICGMIAKPAIITTGASANSYQLIFTFTTRGNGSNNATLTIDDYRTSSTSSMIILPVRFSNFTIKPFGNGASLSWNIEAEENVKAYEVERGVDGKSFSKIGSVLATNQKTYTYGDEKILAGSNYYRIKSLDADGHATYSAVVSLKNGKSAVIFKAFPTLTKGIVNLQHDATAEAANITVIAIDGRIVKMLIPSKGVQQTLVDLTTVQKGIYFVRYTNASGSVETVKIVKQ